VSLKGFKIELRLPLNRKSYRHTLSTDSEDITFDDLKHYTLVFPFQYIVAIKFK